MSNRKGMQVIVIIASIGVIVASLAWIYLTQFAAPKTNLVLHQGIGEVMAQETSKLLGRKGQVIVLAINLGVAPELGTQLATFQEAIGKGGGIAIKETVFLDTENQPKYGTGRGLSARRFVGIVKKKGASVDAIVSFVGAPNLSDADFSELEKTKLPKFIAESGSASKLKKLFDKNVLQTAIVARYQFPAPSSKDPRTAREWFEKRCQVVTSETAATLPGPAAAAE